MFLQHLVRIVASVTKSRGKPKRLAILEGDGKVMQTLFQDQRGDPSLLRLFHTGWARLARMCSCW